MHKHKINITSVFAVIILSVFSFVQIFPFYLSLVSSLEPLSFVPKYGKIYLWPEAFTFKNYYDAFIMAELGEGLINTLIAASMYTLLSLIIALIVGYVLGKKEFKGKKLVILCLLGTMIIPGEILMVPNYFIVIKLGWLNKLCALFLPGIVNILSN